MLMYKTPDPRNKKTQPGSEFYKHGTCGMDRRH